MSLTHRVLVVDDEADIVELLTYNLEKEGYKVASAPDGKKAIEIAKEFLPDLVILDIMMPHFDGIEVGRMIRSQCLNLKVRIFFISRLVRKNTQKLQPLRLELTIILINPSNHVL